MTNMSATEKKPWQILVLWYAVFVLLRFILAILLTEPCIMPDELTYKSMAFGFYQYQDFFALTSHMVGAPTSVGYILYQFFLSSIFFFHENFLIFAKLLNSLLINAAIFPLYGILRHFVPAREAIKFSALPLLIPTFGYASFLMAENLYIPLFALFLYSAYNFFTHANLPFSILLSVSFIMLCLTKPHGLALMVPLLLCGGFLFFYHRNLNHNENLSRKILLSFYLVFAILVFALGISWLLLGKNFTRVIGFNVAVAEGISNHVFSIIGSGAVNSAKFIKFVATQAGSFLFLFLIPFVTILWTWTDAIRNREKKNLTLSTLGLFFLAALFLLVLFTAVFFSTAEYFVRLHGRFLSMILPVLLIAFMVFRKEVTWTPFRKVVLGMLAAFTILAILPGYSFYFKSPFKFTLPVDYPEVAWAAFLPDPIIALMVIIFVFSAIWIMVKNQTWVYILFFGIYALVANFAQTSTFLNLYQPAREATRPARHFIMDTIRNSDARVAVFDAGKINRYLTVFWLPYTFTMAGTLPENSILKREQIPKETDFVVLFGAFQLDFQPVRQYERSYCRIIRLNQVQEVLGDFFGIFQDAPGWAWTKKKFSYIPPESFKRMILTLNGWRDYFSKSMTVEMEQGKKVLWLNRGQSRFILPFSTFYTFSLSKTFNPRRRGLNPEDNRELGISIRSAVIEF
jgi:hypothetical protein